MPRFRLLLLDAVIVIAIHELGLWNRVVERCDVHLTRTIVAECDFYKDENGDRHQIDLTVDQAAGRITVHDPPVSAAERLAAQFGPVFLDQIHTGEREALAVLCQALEPYTICSADKIVFRILGALSRGDQGVSLEELLSETGLSRDTPAMYGKRFRERWTRQGFQEGIQGLSSIKPAGDPRN